MTKQSIFKTFGLLALSIFAVGIFFLSVRANQVQAHGLTQNTSQMMGQTVNANGSYEHHNNLTLEQMGGMIDLMKQHHGENWQDHHLQMHGSDNGIQKEGGGL